MLFSASIFQTKPPQSESELKAQEEEELQLAMALSLSAAEVDQQVCKALKFWNLEYEEIS